MQFPITTGEAARLLGSTEPKLAETVRRGRVKPAPVVRAGRRLWELDQFCQAARALKIPEDELDRILRAGKAIQGPETRQQGSDES